MWLGVVVVAAAVDVALGILVSLSLFFTLSKRKKKSFLSWDKSSDTPETRAAQYAFEHFKIKQNNNENY